MRKTTKVAMFSSQTYDMEYFSSAVEHLPIQIENLPTSLNMKTVQLAKEYDAVCVFVNDELNADVISELASFGIKLIALRCAGYNNVDLQACREHEVSVVRVPEYSPYAVAEHTFGLILTLNRKIHKAFNRVREGNFELDGLMGFDLYEKTISVIGSGKIGSQVAKIASGFGMDVLLVDPFPNPELETFGDYTDLQAALEEGDIVTLHCPLTAETADLIDSTTLDKMKPGAMLVNTSRGGLVDTAAVIQRLKWKQLGALAIDVYEEEADLFFEDHSKSVITDDVFARLLTFPNVLITGHQAFFTHEAMTQIANTTVDSISDYTNGMELKNAVEIPSGFATS